jgi:hypothetical protein
MRFLCLPRHNHINQFGLSKLGHVQVIATNLKQRRMYNLTISYGSPFIDSINLTNGTIHDDSSGTANETSDKITAKTGKKMRQAMTHTWAPGTSHKLKTL